MVDWHSPEVVARSLHAFQRMPYVFLGLCIWEWGTSFQWELDFFTRKKFRWPLIFYLLSRYSPLVWLCASIAFLESHTAPVNCKAIFAAHHFGSHGALSFSSINLALRTSALWPGNRYVQAIFIGFTVGQWITIGMISRFFFEAQWVPDIGCVTEVPSVTGFIIFVVCTLIFDLLVLALALYKLIGTKGLSIPSRRHGRIRYILFTQGISYFVITAALNIFSLVVLVLQLNELIRAVMTSPLIALTSIIACRMVRNLTDFAYTENEIVLGFSTKGGTRPKREPGETPGSAIRFQHSVSEL